MTAVDTPEEVTVLYTEEDGVARITLNRPQRRNAMTATMDAALRDAFMRARQSRTCRVILLTGAGGSFCSGADLSAPKPRTPPPWDRVPETWERYRFSYIVDTEQPIVAALPGYSIGVGLVIACLADIRISTPTAELGFPYARLGLVAEYGITSVLADIVGRARATELLLGGDRISGELAASIGLVHRLIAAERIDEDSLDYARALANERSPVSLKAIKQQIRASRDPGFLVSVQNAGRALDEAVKSRDYMEARAAFIERRAPKFTGD
jgi:enoyl-CoA hydratase/carnithine racemase